MNQNDNSGCSSIFVVILGIVLFIIGPIVTTISVIISVPVEIKVFYFLWLLFCLAIYTFVSDGKAAFGICCVPTLIYGIVHASWYAEYELEGYYGGGGLGDTIGIVLMPFAILVPLYFFGNIFKKKYEQHKQAKVEAKIKILQDNISHHQRCIVDLESKVSRHRKVIDFLQLIRVCGGITTGIEDREEISDVQQYLLEIKDHKDKINEIAIQLQSISKRGESK